MRTPQAYNYGITPIPEEQYLEQLGFDYTYDKGVLDNLVANNLNNLRGYISSQSQVWVGQCVCARGCRGLGGGGSGS